MAIIEKLFEIIFPPTAIFAGVVYLLRKYIDKHFDKETEKFKLGIQSEMELSRIEFQTQMQARLFEYQTKFSLFHQKQADIVADLYSQLSDVSAELAQLTAPLQFDDGVPLKDKKKVVADKFNEVSRLFSRQQIYFNDALAAKILSVIRLMKMALVEFDAAHSFGMEGSDRYRPDETGQWSKAWSRVSEQLPPLLKEVESYFKDILAGKYHVIREAEFNPEGEESLLKPSH